MDVKQHRNDVSLDMQQLQKQLLVLLEKTEILLSPLSGCIFLV